MSSAFRMTEQAERQPVFYGTMRWLSNPQSTGAKQVIATDVVIVPGQGHAFHKHPDQEEMIYVVSGKLEQWLAGEKRFLGPGDAVFIEKGLVHASFNAGKEDVQLIVVFSPSVGDNGFESVEVADEMPWADLRVA